MPFSLVKVAETVVIPYCDFCAEPEEEKGRIISTEEIRKEKEKRRALFSCTLCGHDLCLRHVYHVILPRDLQDAHGEASFEYFLRFHIHPDFGDGSICPDCAQMPLGRIGILLLQVLKREFESKKRT